MAPFQEDEAVRKLVDQHGDRSKRWVLVAAFLNSSKGANGSKGDNREAVPGSLEQPARSQYRKRSAPPLYSAPIL